MQRGTKSMIRKILFSTLLICTTLAAHAQTETLCLSSAKLAEMREEMPSLDADMQNAYNELFSIMLTKDESGSIDNAGCIEQSDLAQVCKNTWDTDTEKCETFVYNVTTEARRNNFKPLAYSTELRQTDFSNIDPDVFNQAVNKAVARRSQKSTPSKLQNMGTTFLEQAKEKQLNPFVSAAISLYESNRGTSSLARTKNNIAGLGGPGRWMSFATVPDSIASQAKTLYNKVESGKRTLHQLACSGSYCATNTSPWFQNVSSITKELYRFYNSILQNKK